MIALLPIVLGIVVGLAAGGSLAVLKELQPPNWAGIAIGLFTVQSVVRAGYLELDTPLVVSVWVLCGVVLAVMLLARPAPSLRLCAVGIMLNTLVVVFNSGMPFVVPAAWPASWAGSLEVGVAGFYAVADPTSSFVVLGDVVPTPIPSLVSAGDILLAVGIWAYLCRCLLGQSAGVYLAPSRKAS